MSEPKIKGGLPIFLENFERDIADPADEAQISVNWVPGNPAATRLWRCVEALRDIQTHLAEAGDTGNPKKQRRRLKALTTPLLSLAQNARSLCSGLATDPAHNTLSTAQRSHINLLREAFEKDVPIDKNSLLVVVRNKLAAHVDNLRPEDAHKLLSSMSPGMFGAWLHGCIWILTELIDLPVFRWRSADAPDGYIRLMHFEPWVVTVGINPDKPARLGGCNIGDSPSMKVYKLCEDLVQDSQWLFKKNEPRLVLRQAAGTGGPDEAEV